MPPGPWKQVVSLCKQVLGLEPAAREHLLASLEPDLRYEVESLLKQIRGSLADLAELEATSTIVASIGVGSQLGPYKIESQLGAGGMGQVFCAFDTRLGRKVAIKTSKVAFEARFEREARAIAQLNHPHICTLHDIGPNYLVMELVDGETLAARLKKDALSVEQSILYGAQIADALAAAHQKGITHRDLKPGNIMVTKSGIKVLDFGLAKMQSDETLTAANAVMGTPAYMAPEQREGRECDPRTDIFALGLVLYEMTAGRRVPQGASPPLENLPDRFAHVIDLCLATDPDDRWQAAKDVCAELRWAGKVPVQALQVSEHRVVSRKMISATLLLAAAMLVVSWLPFTNGSAGREANTSALLPESSLLTIANYTGTERAGTISPDGKFFAFVSDRGGSPDIWVRQISGGEPVQITHDAGGEQDLVYAPDGESIYYATVSNPPLINRVAALGGTPRKVVSSARWPAPAPNGKQIAYGSVASNVPYGDAVMVSDVDGSNSRVIKNDAELKVRLVRWSPDGSWIAFAGGQGLFSQYTIHVIDSVGQRSNIVAPVKSGTIFGLSWAGDSHHIVYSHDPKPLGDQADLSVVSIDGGSRRRLSLNPKEAFRDVDVSLDGKRLLGTLEDTSYEILRVPLGTDPSTNARAAIQVLSSNWQPMWIHLGHSGLLLFNSPAAGDRNLWTMSLDTSSDPRQVTFQAGGQISHSALSPDGTQVAFVSLASGIGQIWVASADGSSARRLTTDAAPKSWPFWSPDGKWIMFASQPSEQIWKIPSAGGKAQQFTRDGGRRGDWSPKGDRVAYDIGDSRIRIANAFTGEVLREVKGGLTSPVWSPDGKRISANGSAGVWTSIQKPAKQISLCNYPQSTALCFVLCGPRTENPS